MTNTARILELLQKNVSQWVCTKCLKEECGIKNAYQACHHLMKSGRILQKKTKCSLCPETKTCNQINSKSTAGSTNGRKTAPTVSPQPIIPIPQDVKNYLFSLNGRIVCDKCIADTNNWDLNTVTQICDALAQSPNPVIRRSTNARCDFQIGKDCSKHVKSKVLPLFRNLDKLYTPIIPCFVTPSGVSQKKPSVLNTSMGDLEMVRAHVSQTSTPNRLAFFLGELICDFMRTATPIFGHSLIIRNFKIDPFGCPHQIPIRLKPTEQAIYLFCDKDGVFLKIGQVGPNSNLRYQYQHYKTKALSTLAKSILADSRFPEKLTGSTVGPWIQKNLWRANIILDRHPTGFLLLNLLEAYLHVRFNPLYEKG